MPHLIGDESPYVLLLFITAVVSESFPQNRLCGCKLKEDICDSLAKSMEMPSAQLKILDMSYNPLTDGGVEKVLQGISSKTCVLETLRYYIL